MTKYYWNANSAEGGDGVSRKEVRELIRYLEKLGWMIRSSGKHYVAMKPGHPRIPIPKTPSDWRGLKNSISRLRKEGVQWPPEGKKPSGRK